jgi:hypothetical protein
VGERDARVDERTLPLRLTRLALERGQAGTVFGTIIVMLGGVFFVAPLSAEVRARIEWSEPPTGIVVLLGVIGLGCAFCAAIFVRIALSHGPDRHPLIHVLMHEPDDVERLIRGAAIKRIVQGVDVGTFQTLYVNCKSRKKAIELNAKIDTIDGVVAEIEAWLKDPNRDEVRKKLGYVRDAHAYRDAPSPPPPQHRPPGAPFVVVMTLVFAGLLALTPEALDRIVPAYWPQTPKLP